MVRQLVSLVRPRRASDGLGDGRSRSYVWSTMRTKRGTRGTVLEKLLDSATKFEALMKLAEFSESTVRAAFDAAGGQCECTREHCDEKHGPDRCPRRFKWDDRGKAADSFAWQAHHWVARAKGGKDDPANCEILCVPCHISTESYGRSG